MNYYDLTLIEFLDVLFDKQNEYTYSVTDDKEVRQELCTKTIEQYRSMILTIDLEPELKKSILASMEGKPERKFDMELTDIEIYNYLEKITSDFDKEKLNSIYWVINAYYQTFRVEIVNPESYGIYKYKKWDIPYHDVKFGSKIERYVDYKTMVSKTHAFMYMDIEYCWNLINRKRSENQQLDIATTVAKKLKTIKEPLSFAGLFKNPHNQDLEQFKNKLKESNLIDNNYQWRTIDNNGKRLPSKDIGKFYDWLYSDTTVFDKIIDKTAHCICFCAEFGIIAYEGAENKPETGRVVTAKLIRESTFDRELKDKHYIHFKEWINKEK